ncbi:MAG: type IX secretion system membrane protein PorP/SprF [Candidatus Pseudobacter hemicellulosilyticus]|uniref:Type IX secretion system membrane protein PorP/SprF n=1 Tax=Candidatus Pseudobacter hemicellulosilyticus TaxID=3121375 RepID=A0AAJ6BIK9_9BACT|nr:MAG: type IX secretion system membrane protein PorP/SprF [Pseudobacter sp.]
MTIQTRHIQPAIGLLLLLGPLFHRTVHAQQQPHYTQYILNQYILNPALTGIENYTDIKLSHRHQWSGLQGSPVTTYFTVHAPLGKADYRTTATSFDVPGQNPRGQRYWESYTAAVPHHGIGAQVVNDVTGALSHFNALLTYAYHIGISPRTSLSAGFGAGFSRFSLNSAKLNFGTTTVDPIVYSSGVLNKMTANFSAGLYLYAADYFIGLSAQQLAPARLSYTDNTISTTGQTVPHFFATAGYRFLLDEDFNLIPSLMLKYVSPLPVQPELNIKLQYRDVLWLGTSARYKDGYAAMFGLKAGNALHIGYSYDRTTSSLNNYSTGSHELLLGFILGNKYSDACPRNIW